MSFEYSSFISYRRNKGDKNFLKKFKKIIACEAQRVTNIEVVFFDSSSIELGDEFDEKIYNSIISSCFFIPIYHMTYLHIDNVWCARELYQALEVEKIIRKKISDDSYCYVLPMVFGGALNDLPECIATKNAKDLRRLEIAITSEKATKKLSKFKGSICKVFHKNFQLLSKNSVNLRELCEGIYRPSDKEIKKWIEEQKKEERKAESEKSPILIKHEE